MKSRVTVLVLTIAVLLLLLAAGVLSLFLLDFGIQDKGGKLPAKLARGQAKGDKRGFTPSLHEIIDVGNEKGTSATPADSGGSTTNVTREEDYLGASFGGPVLSVGCPHCVTYGQEVVERRRFPSPAIHDIALLSDGAIITLYPGTLTDEGRAAAEEHRKAAETAEGQAAANASETATSAGTDTSTPLDTATPPVGEKETAE